MSNKQTAIDYFFSFSSKDIISLQDFFDDHIILRDWDIEAKGITDVLSANSSIFENVDQIEAIPLNILESDQTIIAELSIVINSLETLKVVDILEFSESGKIKAIRAYKG